MSRRAGSSITASVAANSNVGDQPPLESLFSFRHLKPVGLAGKLLLLFYLPIGLSLLVFRLCLFFAIGVVLVLLPGHFFLPTAVVRLLLPAFGIVSSCRSLPGAQPISKASIIACNHRGGFDVFPFLALCPVNVLLDKGFFDGHFVAKQFQKLVGAMPIDRGAARAVEGGAERLRQSIAEHIKSSKRPLLFFPEGWDTNGRSGLLVFQKFLFSLDIPVQPATLEADVPLLPIFEPSKLGSTIFREVLFLFFMPFVRYRLQLLPTVAIQPNETPEMFAGRVQALVAHALKIHPTSYTFKDALALRLSRMSQQRSWF